MDLSIKTTTTQNTWLHYPQIMHNYRYSYGTNIDFSYHQETSAHLRNSPLVSAERLSPLSNTSAATNYTQTSTYKMGILSPHENIFMRLSPSSNNNMGATASSSSHKRQRTSSESEHKTYSSDDSGIDLTPKRHHPENYQLLSNQVHIGANHHTPLPLNTATTTALTHLSDDKLYNIFSYHGNMVRKYPQKERSAKEQEQRNRNTIACRMSRRLKKLQQIAVEEQSKVLEQQFTQCMEQKLRVKALLAHLMAEGSKMEQCKENVNAETEFEIDVVGLGDENALASAPAAGEWRYNECAGKIQWQHFSLVTPQTVLTPTSGVSRFSIDYLLRN